MKIKKEKWNSQEDSKSLSNCIKKIQVPSENAPVSPYAIWALLPTENRCRSFVTRQILDYFFLDNFNNNLWWKTSEKIQTPTEFEPVPCTYYRYHWFAREFPTIFFPWLLFSFKKLILFIYGKFTDANDLTLAKQKTSFHLNEMRKSLKSPFLFFSVRKQLSS